MLDLNIQPYFSDFDDSKNYHKILFVPSRPIQARELNQIQDQLQHQIKLQGDYFFKNGAMVIPGNVNYIDNATYINVKTIYNDVHARTLFKEDDFIGSTITSDTTGVKAVVVHYEEDDSTDEPVIFVRYISGGQDGGNFFSKFQRDEVLTISSSTHKIQVSENNDYTGEGSLATIEEGIYYINGYYVQNLKQTIVLDAHSNKPTYKVGLLFEDSIVTAKEDITLRDNAIGSSNYGVIGADRYKIELTLTKRALFTSDENTNTTDTRFIDLLHVKNGEIQFKINQTELSEFERTLARRTFDESGDYIVKPFTYDILEYRDNNRGQWETAKVYIEGDIVWATVNTNKQYFVALTSGTSGAATPAVNAGETTDGTVTWLATKTPNFNGGLFASTADHDIDTQLRDSQLGVVKVSDGTAYVKGYEVDIVGYRTIAFNKAREFKHSFSATTATTEIGQYLIVNNVQGLPPITFIDGSNKPLDSINIQDAAGTVVGTCRIRNVEYHSGIMGNSDCQYKVYVFDVKMTGTNKFERDARKLAFSTTFSADIFGTRRVLSGTVTSNNTTTVVGEGTLVSAELNVNDTVVINDVSYKVTGITDAITFTVNANVPTAANLQYYKETTELRGYSSLLIPMPNRFVRSIRGENDIAINTTYSVKRLFSKQTDGSGAISITLEDVNETFSTVTNTDYHVTLADGTGNILPLSATRSNGNKTLNVAGLSATTQYYIMTTVDKVTATAAEKKKIRKVATLTFDSVNEVDLPELPLSEADVVNIVSITQSGGVLFDYSDRVSTVAYAEAGETDVTTNYNLDTGQTQYYYGLGKLIPINGFTPAAPIRVTFEYFDHTDGDYFSVDSYDVPYHLLPVYNGVLASDYIDMRPRIADSGADFDATNGASLTEPMSHSYNFIADYSYFLPRRDSLEITAEGLFRISEGLPADRPVSPTPATDATAISYIDLVPYTMYANKKHVQLTENSLRRYTMKDIGKLDNRLKNVEYYASLSALEKQTQDLQIQDEFGLDRFKNGFIVDQFKDHGVGNVTHPDYKCAIDEMTKECRPSFSQKDIKLLEKAPQSRGTNNYQITGDLITLPYTETPLIEQKIATSAEFITPFTHIRTMEGDLNLYPASDTWISTEDLPEVIQQSEGNFAAIEAMAQASGILGATWNSWQEVGRTTISQENITTSSTRSFNNLSGWQVGNIFGGDVRRQVERNSANPSWFSGRDRFSGTVTTSSNVLRTTDEVTIERTGTETFVEEQFDEVGRTSAIVNQNLAPFMREKAVVLYSKRMMPITSFSAYIDNVDLTSFVVPADTIRFTSITGTFIDLRESTANQENIDVRQYGDNEYDIIDRGEIIQGNTSGATAILVTTERQTTNGASEDVLKVINVKGTFSQGETITGLTSGATVTFDSLTTETATVTNSAGAFYGILMIPNTDEIKVQTGIVTVSLRDDFDYDDITTKSEGPYNGQGTVQFRETTIMSVRNGVITTRDTTHQITQTENFDQVSGTGTTVNSVVTNCNCDCDPLGQSFQHSDEGGVFVTSIDLYFHSIDPDPTASVFFQIRESVNGYPGAAIVPFSNVTKMPHELNASETGLLATNFKFQSPVYLERDKEYCLVIGGETSNTKMWIAKMGEVDLLGNLITKQPHMGSFFRSQNLSTWTADQLSDMAFTLYKAEFDTSKTGVVKFGNLDTPSQQLRANPFKVVSGLTTARVYQPNHGMTNGDSVTFSGVSTNITPTSAQLNATFTIANVETDSYTITLPAAANATGIFGGLTAKATQNHKTDVMYLNGNEFVIPGTNIDYSYRGTYESGTSKIKDVIDYPINIKKNTIMDKSRYILSKVNKDLHLAGEDSLTIKAYMYSDNPNLSPVIDLSTMSVHTVQNRINNPSFSEIDIDKQTLVSAGDDGVIDINSTGFIQFNANYINELKSIKVGTYLKMTATTLDDANIVPILITGTETDDSTYVKIYTSATLVDQNTFDTTTNAITVENYNHHIDNISPNVTSNDFNYIIKNVELSKQSTGFKLIFAYNKPSDVNIKVYYKAILKSSYKEIEKENWTLIDDADITYITDPNQDIFYDQDIDVDTNTFDKISVKLVATSDNSAKVARFGDLRLIALA